MATKQTKQNLLGKVTKEIDADLTITIASNGYVVKITGRDNDDNWQSSTVVCNSFDDLEELVNTVKVLNG